MNKEEAEAILRELPDARAALMVAHWEQQIISNANYLLSSNPRHPACERRASRYAFEAAKGRRFILDKEPSITSDVLNAAHFFITDADARSRH